MPALQAAPDFDPKPVLAALPGLPGVYRMLNDKGEVIYVGKARDLKKRVSSYFQKGNLFPRTALMVAQVRGVEVTVTRSESEALLLESNLIKRLAPRYNVVFRDDKSYPYIMLTGHRYPQIRFFRGSFDKTNRYFGPFPSAWAVRDTIGHLQKVFRLRTCDDTVFEHRSRPCLLHQIERCSAPCVGLIDEHAYAQDIAHAALFLEGHESEVIDQLTVQMDAAAERQDYERAASVRDQIRALQRVLTKQFVASASERDADVIACESLAGNWCVTLAMVRGGRHLGDRSFFPANAAEADVGDVTQAFIEQHYSEWAPPPSIIVSAELEREAIEAMLSERAARPVKLVLRPVGEGKAWLMTAARNARLALEQRAGKEGLALSRLDALRDALALPEPPKRIECFDISHAMGEATVASCVVWDDLAMRSGEYRRFNISGITPGDDYGAMRQALQRRYKRVADGDATLPDLILIDGGIGQVRAAKAALDELGVTDAQLIGVAKGEERKPGLETLVYPDARPSVSLPSDHPGLHLIQVVRDEAHRFAISGHRAKRAKARTRSVLDDVEGVGPKKKQALLNRFGGLQGLQRASVDDLAAVSGISRKLAEDIYAALH